MTLVWSLSCQKFGHFNVQSGVILTSKEKSLGHKKALCFTGQQRLQHLQDDVAWMSRS